MITEKEEKTKYPNPQIAEYTHVNKKASLIQVLH